MSLADRLREMLDPSANSGGMGSGAPPPPGHGRRRSRSQAQPVNPMRSYEPEPPRPMARAQWIGLGLAAALAVALTAGLVFAILTITRPTEQRATPTEAPVAASPTLAATSSIAQIFGTFTPTPVASPTVTPPTAVGQRVQVANTGGEGVNLRREPGESGERLRTIREGTVLEIIGPDSTVDGQVWRNVRDTTTNESGWIVSSFLAPEGTVPPPIAAVPGADATPVAPPPAAAPTAAPRPTTAVAASGASRGQVGNTNGQGANIRSEPGSGGRVLKTLPEGAALDVLGPEREIDGQIWRQVRDSAGVTGWIIRGAVAPAGSVPTPAPPAPTRAPAATSSGATPAAKPTQAPAAKPTSGSAATPEPDEKPTAPAKPTTPPGDLPIIIQPATPRPQPPAGSPVPKP